MFFLAGYFNGQCSAFFVVSVGGTLTHLMWQFCTVNLDVPKSCWRESLGMSALSMVINSLDREFQAQWTAWVDYMGRFDDRLPVSLQPVIIYTFHIPV